MIAVKDVRKSYPIGHRRREVLKGINLVVNPGDRIGLLGRNGAGKSTLIKLIGGVEHPSSGTIRRRMSCSWPLGFNGGFQGSLTGFDNTRFIARIYGRDYDDMRAYVEEFSELGGQLKMPVKTYSSGMRARLAFALSLSIEFECYLIDEVMLVGDRNFQEKCRHELFERRQDRAIVLASHDNETVREVCNAGALIHGGRLSYFPRVDEALRAFDLL